MINHVGENKLLLFNEIIIRMSWISSTGEKDFERNLGKSWVPFRKIHPKHFLIQIHYFKFAEVY